MLRRGAAADDAGVVHQDVDVAERRDRVGDQRVGRGAIGEVRGEELRAPAALLADPLGRLGGRLLVAVQRDSGAGGAIAAAMAAPRPREAPVTSATFPSSENTSRVIVSASP